MTNSHAVLETELGCPSCALRYGVLYSQSAEWSADLLISKVKVSMCVYLSNKHGIELHLLCLISSPVQLLPSP